MKGFWKGAAAALIACALQAGVAFPASAQNAPEIVQDVASRGERLIRIGVLNCLGHRDSLRLWQPTVDYLNTAIADHDQNYHLQILVYDEQGLRSAAENGEIQFAVTSPSTEVYLENRASGRHIASLIRGDNAGQISGMGSAVIVRSDRTDIQNFSDLQDKNVLTINRDSWGGWQILAYELSQHGIDVDRFFETVLTTGGNHQDVVLEVLDGVADAGIVRTGILEYMEKTGRLDPSKIRVVPLDPAPDFPFALSTQLYPEWSVVAMPDAPFDLTNFIGEELLEMTPLSAPARAGAYFRWGPPGGHKGVENMLRTLQAAPFENIRAAATSTFIRQNRREIVIGTSLACAILCFLILGWRRSANRSFWLHKGLAVASRSQEFYRRAVEDHALFCTMNYKGQLTYTNDLFRKESGYSKEELDRRPIIELMPGGLEELMSPKIQNSLSKGETWTGELQIRKKDGDVAVVQCNVIPIGDPAIRIVEYAVIATDVTENKMREAKRSFNQTLELMLDEVFVTNAETFELAFVNKAGRQYLDQYEPGWKGRSLKEILPPDQVAKMEMIGQNLADTPDRPFIFEFDRKDGLPIEVSVQLIRPAKSAPLLVAIYRDISSRRVAERAKDEFVSTVSHELRTPLTSIKGALGLALTGSLGEVPEQMQRLLSIAESNCNRLVTLINDILDIEKIESGKMEFALEPMDARDLLVAAVENNKHYGEKYKVTYKLEMPDTPVPVNGNADRLMQVMDNLMSNAAKFSNPGDDVVVSLKQHEGQVHVSVRDFGMGISDEFKTKIFDKFTQADSSDTRQKGGTGLGLSIAKLIVEHHGGAIGFESEAGKGTDFYFDIPLLRSEEDPAPQHKTEPAPEGALGSILVCEDDRDVADILRTMLERRGYHVTLAHTGLRAQELLEQARFDGMTLDLGLPDKNGMDILREMASENRLDDLPVVVISANADKIDGPERREMGDSVQWIDKPIAEPLLRAWLEGLVQPDEGGETHRPRILHVESDQSTQELVNHLVGDAGEVTGADSVRQARKLIEQNDYDLVIMETAMPDGDGCILLPLLADRFPKPPPVIIFSVNDGVTIGCHKNVAGTLTKSKATNNQFAQAVHKAIGAEPPQLQ